MCFGVWLTSTNFPITLQPLVADQATIQPIKGDMCSFHMRHASMIWCKRLQRYRGHKPLYLIGLVYLKFLSHVVNK